jgi:hypothetical protein
MKSGKRPFRLTRKSLKKRNSQVRTVIAKIESLTEELAATSDPKRKSEIHAELKQMRLAQKSLSLSGPESKSSVPLPRSYLEARAEWIKNSRRHIRFVQGGAPGGGRKR